MPIQVLPELLVNRIAAGEVIVRPASVVKELLENAIDAGASRVVIEIANGARDITVRDDGMGIAREDAHLALQRHATSKIHEFDDLYRLDTRGFRGEALASIASVARVQILTRRRGDVAGTRILADGPGAPRIETAGAPEGTEVRVRELFFNTPARLKFLKTPAAELNQILQMVTRQAYIRPDIGFTVENERGRMLDLPPAQDWLDRVAALLGGGVREHLLDVDEERHGVHVTGFVARPAAARKDRRNQFFNVQGRPVSSRSMSFVLQEAYRGIIMVQRYPICVLNMTLAEGEVDINVHPTKEEVRFRSESLVNGVLHRVVHARLQRANLMPVVTFDEGQPSDGAGQANERPAGNGAPTPARISSSQPASPPVMGGPDFSALPQQADMLPDMGPQVSRDPLSTIPVDFSMFTSGLAMPSALPPAVRQQAQAAEDFHRIESGEVYAHNASPDSSALAAADGPEETPAEAPVTAVGTDCSVRPVANSLGHVDEAPEDAVNYALLRNGTYPEPIGQIARCYILAQMGHDMLIIDQHAAHERLMYLKFSRRRAAPPSQPLLIPVSVDVPANAVSYMNRLQPVFDELGLRVDHFGGQTYLVQSVPADLAHINVGAVIADLLDDFEALGKVEQVEILRDRIITRMACRAAVKAGQQLHLDEMRALIRDIANARLGFTCPHGRPTMVLMTRAALDKQFKRTV